MTSEEIKQYANDARTNASGTFTLEYAALMEIAYQLAVMNERAQNEIEREEALADAKARLGVVR